MDKTIHIFISYSHLDQAYLEKDSLFGFIQGLERDGIEFWTDREIQAGELWDEVIKDRILRCDIALVLVSQGFLDSEYCRDVEIERFLAEKKYVFPVILSPCDWQRHPWLASRQFLPGGGKTVEEHYQQEGEQKRLFLAIREQLLHRARLLRESRTKESNLFRQISNSPVNGQFTGKHKLAFCQRLGTDWRQLADYFEISTAEQACFSQGDEARAIWAWLDNRRRLPELPSALAKLGRTDLADLLSGKVP